MTRPTLRSRVIGCWFGRLCAPGCSRGVLVAPTWLGSVAQRRADSTRGDGRHRSAGGLFPALIPRDLFERSGRWADYGDALFRLQDRRQADYLLAPTHEEIFTLTVKAECSSYKDLPLSPVQIQTKYRVRPAPVPA